MHEGADGALCASNYECARGPKVHDVLVHEFYCEFGTGFCTQQQIECKKLRQYDMNVYI